MANFSLGIDWTSVELSNGDLTNTSIGVSRLTSVNFTDARMPNVSIANSYLMNVDFAGANLSELSASAITRAPASQPTNWRLVDGYLCSLGAICNERTQFVPGPVDNFVDNGQSTGQGHGAVHGSDRIGTRMVQSHD
jgi:hypothetical protein